MAPRSSAESAPACHRGPPLPQALRDTAGPRVAVHKPWCTPLHMRARVHSCLPALACTCTRTPLHLHLPILALACTCTGSTTAHASTSLLRSMARSPSSPHNDSTEANARLNAHGPLLSTFPSLSTCRSPSTDGSWWSAVAAPGMRATWQIESQSQRQERTVATEASAASFPWRK